MMKLLVSDIKFYLRSHGLISTIFNLGFWTLLLYRMGNSMSKKKIYRILLLWYLYTLAKNVLLIFSKIELPPTAQIGSNINLVHAYGLVMGDKVIVKSGVTIGPWVVIGHNGRKSEQPVIMDNCYLGAKCSVLGGITIGSNSIVAPNTVITVDLPDNHVAKSSFCQIVNLRKE